MTDKNYIYKRLPDGRYIKEIDNKTEHLASAEEDAKLATDIRSLLQGPQGESGTSGTSGQDGTSGRDGAEGKIGRTGLTGPRGLNGTSGSSGSSGQDGTSGVNGQNGTSGVNGRKGEKGDKGDRGFPGLQGPAGRDGSAGVSGTSGTSAPGMTSGTSGSSGTSGTSGAAGISAGQVYYFNKSQASDVNGYRVLDINPSTASQQTSTASLAGSQQGFLVESYITPQLGFAVIPAGIQRFHHHWLKQGSNDQIQFYVEIQLADSSGVAIGPTLSSGSSEIGWVDASTPVEVTVDLTLPTTTIDPTNRMIVRLYLDNNDASAHTVIHYTEGTSYYSFVLTSVGVIGSTSGTSGSSGSSGINGTSGTSYQLISFKSTAPGATVSPTSSNVVIASVTIPANTFTSSDVIDTFIMVSSSGSNSKNCRGYIGTYSIPVGQPIGSSMSQFGAGNNNQTGRTGALHRRLMVYSANGTGEGTQMYPYGALNNTDEAANSGADFTLLPIDWTKQQYIYWTNQIVTATPTDSTRMRYFYVSKIA